MPSTEKYYLELSEVLERLFQKLELIRVYEGKVQQNWSI